jgi:uncharacterized membrane protein
MPWKYTSPPSTAERIVGGLCYLTFGLAGIIYIVLSGRHGQSDVFRFHFMQSILLGILGILFGWTIRLFDSTFLSLMGGIGIGVVYVIDLLMKAAYLLLLYGMIASFLGKYAKIPLVSNIVRRQM